MYYKTIEKDGCIYSIDRFTFDFYFLPESGLFDLLKTSLDLLVLEYCQQISVQNFTTNRLGFEKFIYQFEHLHVELWQRENIVKISRYLSEADEYKYTKVAGEKQSVLRLDFNPNKCENLKPLERLMNFFATTNRPFVFSVSRVDYAMDLPEPIENFYVLSRKMETFYGSTRYYGVQGLTGRLRVYDKRKEQIDKEKNDIGHELTRFEWEQRGNRDFNFTFDKINHFDPDKVSSALGLLRFVQPELVNTALATLDKRTRKKLKDEAFQSLIVSQEAFQTLLNRYFELYKLPMEYRRDWEKQFVYDEMS